MTTEQPNGPLGRYAENVGPLPLSDGLFLSGKLLIEIQTSEPEKVIIEGVDRLERLPDGHIYSEVHNAFVNTGLNMTLDRLFSLSGPPSAIDHIGLSSDNTAVVAGTTTLGGTVSIKTFTPAASRTGQVVTAGATWTQADVAFAIKKVGLLNTATDAGTGLLDVVGGTGAAPYNQPFTIDLTGATTWTMTLSLQITAASS